jgi:hypothetical protein
LPAPLTGELARPAIVAQRLAPLLGGVVADPLPARTTPAWAGSVVDDNWSSAGLAGYQAAFLAGWFGWEGDPVSQALIDALLSDEPALAALLLTSTSSNRMGIFNEAAFLQKYPTISTRGEAMARALFDFDVPQAPPDVHWALSENLSTSRRRQLEWLTGAPQCANCHALFDPLGVSLEHFDEQGEFREEDNDEAVDSAGSYRFPTSDLTVEFSDSTALGEQLAETCSVHLAFSAQFLSGALLLSGRSDEERAALYDDSLARVQQGFIRGGRTYRALTRAYAQSPAVLRP